MTGGDDTRVPSSTTCAIVGGGPAGLVLLVLERVPALTAIPAFLIGIGPRPERAPGWARRSA